MIERLIPAVKVLALVLVVPPVLLLATCTYTTFSPHLLLDPINASLLQAEDTGWRSVGVALMPTYLPPGQPYAGTLARLESAGYELAADYSIAAPPRSLVGADGTSLARLHDVHAEARQAFNDRGVTHVFERGGRTNLGCGERLVIEAGFTDGLLTGATGYSSWTCL